MGECGNYFFGDLPNKYKTFRGTLKIVVNIGPHGVWKFKTLLPQFSSDLIQNLWRHYLPWGNTGCYFSWQWANLKKNVSLWKFNMGVNWNILTCAISWRRVIVDRNRWKFEIHGLKVYMRGVIFISDCLSSHWGHLVHFAQFLILRNSTSYFSTAFIQFQSKAW